MFFAILFVILLAGTAYAQSQKGWINSFLDIDTFVKVDDSANETADVMYYKPDFMQWRWHYNEETEKYELQTRWNADGMYSYIKSVSAEVNTEGAVLLKNENGALPLQPNAKISLFGVSQLPQKYITTGQGSGFHDPNTDDSIQSCLTANGVEVNQSLANQYRGYGYGAGWGTASPAPEGDINYVEFQVNEFPFSEVKGVADSTIAEYGDSAVYIISRLASESGDVDFSAPDHIDNNYMDLTEDERAILDGLAAYKAAGKLKSIVLVLNTCNAMQFKTIASYGDVIDAILWTGTGGTTAYRALADILTGKADPNGKLADTYLYDNYSAPATVNSGNFTYAQYDGVPARETYTWNSKYVVYQEGIYVGYKYFETRYEDMVLGRGNAVGSFGAKASKDNWSYGEEVAYPFGYGGSYAQFEHSNFSVTERGGVFTAKLTIKNTSSAYSGKDVFQLYLQKPYTEYDEKHDLEKASLELVGFSKTKLLAPGESQTLEVKVDLRDFTSYDTYGEGTYILEKGDYYLAAGTNSHDALNNILARKGAVNETYLDGEGDEDMTYHVAIDADDFETYSTSAATGAEIVNRFGSADPNLYEHMGNQPVTFLSRKNWEDTYPRQAVQLTCTDPGMVKDMQYGVEIPTDPDAEMPKYGQNNGLSLINLMYEDFDSELWEKLLDELTFNEQIDLILLGANALAGATSINAPGASVYDGPAGLRGIANTFAYPGETLMACTFNTELVKDLGEAFGIEMHYYGVASLYGPGANIHRTAFSGRNFEYFSEDGVLSGIMLDAELKGLSSMGIITYTKHFALNDQERNRYGGCVWANEQSIREIYLKSFEIFVTDEDCNALGIMTSFNRIGCTWAGTHNGLLKGVLRGEWGFKGSTMTDAAVGGHMGVGQRQAAASAVVNGQTVWLGDLRSQGFGEYANDPVVAQAIREACKVNLYAKLNSMSMNGMRSGVKIVEITPWWETALLAMEIVVGIITGACIAMTAASFVIVHKNKKKEAEV